MSTDEITRALEGLAGWSYDGDALVKKFTFDDFAGAIAFMADARPQIDELNHHPEWTNVYNRVIVTMSTHDAKGVTERDVALALFMDQLA